MTTADTSAANDYGIEAIEPGDLLADRAYRHLCEGILRDKLQAGTQLSVPALARQMQISRSPVREAVQRLIYEGLAEHVPHRGAVVSRVRADDFSDLLEVRELLEGLAARRAATRMTPDDLAELKAILEAHERVVDSGNDVPNVEYDIAFHQRIREVAGNPHLQITLTRIQARAHLSLYTLWRGERNPHYALDEHRKMYGALATGDPDAAETAARLHIQQLRDRVPGLTVIRGEANE